MPRKIMTLIFSLFFLQIHAMERSEGELEDVVVENEEQVHDPNILTIGELEDFLFEVNRGNAVAHFSEPNHPCDGKIFCKTCGYFAVVSVPVSLILGMSLAIYGCRPKSDLCTPEIVRNKDANSYYIYHCPPGISSADKTWINDQSCISGTTFFSLTPFLPFIAAGLVTPCVWALNKWTARRNILLREDLHDKFSHNRHASLVATEEDVRKVAILLLKAQSSLLEKLSVDQILILAQEDFALFNEIDLEKSFPKASLWTPKLALMFKSSHEELAGILADSRIIAFFKQARRMWETVVRILPEESLSSSINARLGEIFVYLTPDLADKEIDWHSVISDVKEGKQIEDIVAKILIKDQSAKGESIILHTKNGDLALNKARLIDISTFFATSLSKDWGNAAEQDLLKVEEDHINVLLRVVQKEELDFKKDIQKIVATATYFGLKELTRQCDELLANLGVIYGGSSNNLLLKAMNHDKKKPPTIKAQWKFFKANGFVQNQERLARIMLENFAETLDVNLVFIGNYANEVGESLNKKAFMDKLLNPQILSFAWKHFSKITIFREIMVEFCAENNMIVEKAWVLVPEDLAQEILDHDSQ